MAAKQNNVTLRAESGPVEINWKKVPAPVKRMLAAALLKDYYANKEREKAAQAERS